MKLTALTAAQVAADSDPAYTQVERLIRDRVAGATMPGAPPLFTTDADPLSLWIAYLNSLPEERRQHYNCHCCRRFIEKYGGLATIDETQAGMHRPLLWECTLDVTEMFRDSFARMAHLVFNARVNGVLLSSEESWGQIATGPWTHLSGRNFNRFSDPLKSARQRMAELKEEHHMLCRALSEYPLQVTERAVTILEADALDRGEKTLGVAKWFRDLHNKIHDGATLKDMGRSRDNKIWAAIAKAPPGFAHVKASMIGTLLDDIAAGMDIEAVKRRWADKMHPLRYRRPMAPPTDGAIKRAEEIFAKLGLASALKRRFAQLADVQQWLWQPNRIVPMPPAAGGVFDHLRADKGGKLPELELPSKKITWEKFAAEVLPGAREMEMLVPSGHSAFYGLVTAEFLSAPPVLQWDLPERRNPVSWYYYHNGSPASAWGLTAGQWVKVNGIFAAPPFWADPDKARHHTPAAHFALEGARDLGRPALCLFPEILKAELHEIRSVIEAHNATTTISGNDLPGQANGLALQKGNTVSLRVRVRTGAGLSNYELDRWE